MSQPLKSKGKQRIPPPSLFLHPSASASHVTIPGVLVPGAPPQASARTAALAGQTASQRTLGANGSLAPSIPGRPIRSLKTGDSARSGDRTDALWADMQATLEEIALAQAWARSEADDVIETVKETGGATGTEELRNLKGTGLVDSTRATGDVADTLKTAGTNSAARPGSGGGGIDRLEAKLEEETEVDILLARKRREANDQYFQRVNQGVLDVVAKLGEVATAMKTLEQESREIWGIRRVGRKLPPISTTHRTPSALRHLLKMRPFAILAGALALAPGVLSVGVEKSVLVTYNRDAPRVSSLIDQAKAAIQKAGGKITHEFKFINGFHAIVSADVVDTIQKWGGEYITVEEDQRVSITN
ncbi:unnamed protein product [Parascedosporium putredinis]|uniref:Inhibitor I9 domain-containing protein n=2 Tax=Parascedosporium putredinis TaxID=1442378 RepID=A0A9P1HBV8_9PEZI|nr:unnamed protein product [Parascedosporium putredinis]CAI8004147.1 unnamed protein product [Parascedosporium putredinis]